LSQIISSPDRREIIWIDAETCGGPEWINIEEVCDIARRPLPEMKTLGYVVYENELYIAVTDAVGKEETASITKIPKALVIQNTKLAGVTNNESINRE
jgi:hypothetical protein